MSDISPPLEIFNVLPENYLPFELIENILSRLPVKSLKRFRAVEKSWRHLIDSEKFAKTHLKRSLTSNSNGKLISFSKYSFFGMGLDPVDNAQPIQPEFEYDNLNMHSISNSCNGLVVIVREAEPHVLWNPFSSEHKVLPKCPSSDFLNNSSLSCNTSFGFGYDSKNDDYKVVKVLWFKKPPSWSLSVEWIYSLKSNSWRRTDGTFYDRGRWPVHLNGSLHTIINVSNGILSGPSGIINVPSGEKLMGFSVVSEKFYELAMPEGIDEKGLEYKTLDVFDGCLALVCNYGPSVRIWLMKEYGVKESWSAFLSFPVGADDFVRTLAYNKNRDTAVFYRGIKGLVSCNLRTMEVKRVKLTFTFWPWFITETLISPNGWTQKQNNKKEMKNQKKEIKRDDFLSKGFKLVL